MDMAWVGHREDDINIAKKNYSYIIVKMSWFHLKISMKISLGISKRSKTGSR